jgi:Fic family protein
VAKNKRATGEYRIFRTGEETIRAFVPWPLPPTPSLQLTAECKRLQERALLSCGRLDALTKLLPDPNLFLYIYVRREAVLTSQIEGTQSSLSDLLLFELQGAPGVPLDDVVEVSNYVGAQEHSMKRLAENFPLSNRLIREAHGKLLSSGRGAGKQPGEFRSTQNWIGGTRPGNAHFVPPPPEEVEPCMAELERFLHSPYAEGGLVKAALAHVQFETIHPFLDGNGRVGRLLITLILHHEGILRSPLLYLSLYFKQNRAEYYRLLDAVRTDGDWESWLRFFLQGVNETASGAVDTANRLMKLFEEDRERIKSRRRIPSSTLRVFDSLQRHPVANVDLLAKQTGVSYPTAARAVEALNELGILAELTGRRRDRVFAYERYLHILSEGAEPL